uniref:Phospholipase B1, membrane-associated n=1 Tax=Arion vulgaris TaxID=1028688 RepID=A0A0B7ACV2_9EUPU
MALLRVCVLVYLCLYLCLHLSASERSSKDRELTEASLLAKFLGIRFQDNISTKSFSEIFSKIYKKSAFPCPVLPPSATTPTSVHRLRPSDIKVIAALGDSLTAGRGAQGGLPGLLVDYRGLSWSIGGDGDYSHIATLPNILRQYNNKLYGYSEGVASFKSRLNMAKTGAMSDEILEQAQNLVQRLKDDKHVDIANDWKLITIFIGANDLCDWCIDEDKFSAVNYRRNLEETLDYLFANVPRAFVNLVEILDLEFINILDTTPICKFVHKLVCDCASNPKTPEDRDKLIKLREGYQAVTRQLVSSGRYDSSDNFTVVLQPFYENTTIPLKKTGKPDFSYFGSDCFHFSKKSHVASAEALWNNMIEPVGSKQTSWTPGEVIKCPTEASPYLYTAKNSQK